MFFNFKSIRKQQAFWFFVVSILPTGIFFYLLFSQQVETIKKNSFLRLAVVRDLKVQNLNNWLDERRGDTLVLSEVIAHHLEDTRIYTGNINNLRVVLTTYLHTYESYDEIFIIKKDTGRVWASTRKEHEGKDKSDKKYFKEALLSGNTPYIHDIFYSELVGKPSMIISIPVFIDENVFAVLAMRIDLEKSLYKILNEKTGLGETGESYLVNHDYIALNPLKYRTGSALKFQLNGDPEKKGANGKSGVMESSDYRNVPVLAAYTYIPRAKWGFVTKQDISEVYISLYNFIQKILVLIGVILMIIISLAYYLSRSLTRPIMEMTSVAKRIQAGEANVRNKIHQQDELGFLAQAFNDMANSLEGEREFLKNYLEKIIDSMPSALIGVDKDTNVVIWNSEAEKLSGRKSKQTAGRPVKELMPVLSDYIENINLAIRGGRPDAIHTISHVDKEFKRIFDIVIYPLAGLETKGAVIRIDDVTNEFKKDELIRHTQKMDALGKLTGGIAHDFNNLLSVILGYSDLMLEDLDRDAKHYNFIAEINTAAKRARNLTSKLLNFSRKETIERTSVVNLKELLFSEKDMLSKTLTANIDIRFDIEDELWPILVDKSRLEDAILNICINSKQAMPDGGRLTIEAHNLSIKDSDLHQVSLNPGDYVVLSIGDTGIGMSPDIQEKVFDPFFTTKGSEGTGLGLSQVYGFVQQSKGFIHIYSELNHGSRIVIYFLRYNEEHQEDQLLTADSIDEKYLRGNETILVVDDETALLGLAAKILNLAGYTVKTAENAKQAIEILENDSGRVDLMLTDVIMPGMDGYELASIVHNQYPDIKIQMVSGFTDKYEEKYADENYHKMRISKPYDKNILLKRIRELLDG